MQANQHVRGIQRAGGIAGNGDERELHFGNRAHRRTHPVASTSIEARLVPSGARMVMSTATGRPRA